jgi:hypothetical protein
MTRDTAELALAVVLMLGGVVLIFTSSSSALALAMIAVGIAIVTIGAATDKRRGGHAHR